MTDKKPKRYEIVYAGGHAYHVYVIDGSYRFRFATVDSWEGALSAIRDHSGREVVVSCEAVNTGLGPQDDAPSAPDKLKSDAPSQSAPIAPGSCLGCQYFQDQMIVHRFLGESDFEASCAHPDTVWRGSNLKIPRAIGRHHGNPPPRPSWCPLTLHQSTPKRS